MNDLNPATDSNKSDNHNVNLDFVRGVAALLVVMQHLQCFQFLFSAENKIFNYFCSVGGDAVMVFFVLSGYLVGGSVIRDAGKSRWSWTGYLVNRLSRLWMVLIPALLLTVFWDSCGIRLAGPGPYHGSYWSIISSGSGGDYTLNFRTFLGNLCFLQLISFPRLGSDSPLWSLANEFWYYLLFPLLYFSVFGQGKFWNKILNFIIFCGLILFLPKKMAHLGLIWLMGAVVYLVVNHPRLGRIAKNGFIFSFCLGLLIAVTVFSHLALASGRLGHLLQPDFIVESGLVGAAFAGMIPFLLDHPLKFNWYQKISKWLSKISYTMYLVHFPVLAFFFYSFKLPEKDLPSFCHYLLFVFYIVVVLLYSWGMWYLFERRTADLRNRLKSFVYALGIRL